MFVLLISPPLLFSSPLVQSPFVFDLLDIGMMLELRLAFVVLPPEKMHAFKMSIKKSKISKIATLTYSYEN